MERRKRTPGEPRMQDYLKQKWGNPAASQSPAQVFQTFTLQAYKAIHRSVRFCVCTAGKKICPFPFTGPSPSTFKRPEKCIQHPENHATLILTFWKWRRKSASWSTNSKRERHPTGTVLPYLPWSLRSGHRIEFRYDHDTPSNC